MNDNAVGEWNDLPPDSMVQGIAERDPSYTTELAFASESGPCSLETYRPVPIQQELHETVCRTSHNGTAKVIGCDAGGCDVHVEGTFRTDASLPDDHWVDAQAGAQPWSQICVSSEVGFSAECSGGLDLRLPVSPGACTSFDVWAFGGTSGVFTEWVEAFGWSGANSWIGVCRDGAGRPRLDSPPVLPEDPTTARFGSVGEPCSLHLHGEPDAFLPVGDGLCEGRQKGVAHVVGCDEHNCTVDVANGALVTALLPGRAWVDSVLWVDQEQVNVPICFAVADFADRAECQGTVTIQRALEPNRCLSIVVSTKASTNEVDAGVRVVHLASNVFTHLELCRAASGQPSLRVVFDYPA